MCCMLLDFFPPAVAGILLSYLINFYFLLKIVFKNIHLLSLKMKLEKRVLRDMLLDVCSCFLAALEIVSNSTVHLNVSLYGRFHLEARSFYILACALS